MRIPFGATSYDRPRGDFPEIPVINMIPEQTPTEDGLSLISRPGLEYADMELGDGPIRALYRQDGVFDADLFAVSGPEFYRGEDLLGVITGTEAVSIVGFSDNIFVTAGAALYHYNGTTLVEIDTPDSAFVSKIFVAASRLILILAGTQVLFWSEPLSEVIDGLSFASAEQSPDRLLDGLYNTDSLVLFGFDSVEFWPVSSDADLPFQPLIGRTFQIGVKNTGAATKIGPTFAWVAQTNQVCLSNTTTIISDVDLEIKIKAADSVKLWTFFLEGVEFLALSLPTEDFVFHSISGKWTKFQTYGFDTWNVSCYAEDVFGSSEDGRLFNWSSSYEDDGDLLERRFRAWQIIDSGLTVVTDLALRAPGGQTSYESGLYSNPYVEMRSSRDGGFTFTDWRRKQLGPLGKYDKRVVWNGCGGFGVPGILFEFRMTDPTSLRVSGVLINESRGGF